jgi:hypothetical protein
MGVVMAKRLEFEVHGPFDIPLDGKKRQLALDGFWRSDDLEPLSRCCGCYVVALKTVKGTLMPSYVGLTKRTFRDEVFNGSNLSKYGAAVASNKRHRGAVRPRALSRRQRCPSNAHDENQILTRRTERRMA